MSRFLIPLLLAATFAPQDTTNGVDVYKKTVSSIVTLTVERRDSSQITGTAFLAIKDGLAVTAWHVVKDAKRAVAHFATGEEFDVSGVVDQDSKRDVALIKIKVADRPMLALAATEPTVGQKAFVIGAPRGLEFSITDGVVSQVQSFDGVREIQFSCPASPGNSGGPLLSGSGEVLGVVSWQVRDGQNLNFAIPATYVKGLDASLPTKSFDAMSAQEATKPLSQKDEANVPTKALRLLVTCRTESEALYDLMGEITSVQAKKVFVPSSIYAAIDTFTRCATEIEALHSTDESLNKLFTESAERWREKAEGMGKLRDAAARAATTGWDGDANNLLQQGLAKLKPRQLESDSAITKLKQLVPKDELNRYHPDLLKVMFAENPARLFEETIKVGLRFDLRRLPGFVVTFSPAKGTPAEKAGLKPGDSITSVDGGPPPIDWSTFDKLMADSKGKTLKLKVKRLKGDEANLSLRLPT